MTHITIYDTLQHDSNLTGLQSDIPQLKHHASTGKGSTGFVSLRSFFTLISLWAS